ncbi:MAG: cobalt ECF transporter T component CbiQ [Cyanobacteria bacterium CRU_2_1]|nr:cobalt ECF transporter T component CbiQ [Cyanobacteria bacterium CRU_2_1]NJR58511.1 cobalt ECF transporter T component CbiQ [Cyanobacteria bacterium CRU_2_1]
MRVELDEYAHLDSLIHRWEPRSKLVGLLALIFAFAFVEDVRLLPAVVVVTTVLYIASRLPLSVLLKRLRYPGIFLLGIVVVLPFLSGETVIWQWGWLTVRQEGCWAVLLIACRFLAILITGFVLLGTTPFLTLVKAMRSLGLPVILADMTLLSYRYLYEIAGNLATMRQAMRLRGFRSQSKSERFFIPNIGNLRRFASLTGTLFIRSYEQSERIYKAMRLRGYGNARVNHSAIASTPKSFSAIILA